MVFWRNEMRCLTNIITQECVKNGVVSPWGVLPAIREALSDSKPEHVRQVKLHQCPQEDGFVDYVVEIIEADEQEITTHVRHFQGSDGSYRPRHPRSWIKPKAPNVIHGDICLYDQRRDGVVEYLHLKH